MRLVFVHDGPVFFDQNGKYYEYSYHKLYERYSYLADEITFLMRTSPLPDGKIFDQIPQQIQVVGFKNFKSPSLYFKFKPQAEKVIREEIKKADIAVLRESSASTIALKYVKKYKIPYIYECVGCVWDGLWNYSLLGKAMAPLCFLRSKEIIRKASYVHYVTDRFLQKRYPTYGKWIGCSDVCIDKANSSVLQFRLNKIKEFSRQKEISIGTAAAIDVRYKGQEYVIKAVKQLKEKGYTIKYYLAGGNKNKSTYLQDLVRKYGLEKEVVFCGSLSQAEMVRFYDSLDIYVQPSKQEGLPRSVIEAMSRGCPAIGTNVGGIPELLNKECLFKKGSSKAVCNALLFMFNSNLEKYAKKNFKKAQKYTEEKLEKKRMQFYDMFLSENIYKI